MFKKLISRVFLVSCTFFIVLAPGCKLGPDYVKPNYDVPDQWHQAATEGLNHGTSNIETWWQVFNDPVLQKLMDKATEDNLDLQKAYARIMESQAFLGITSGQYWPSVDAVGAYQRARLSENGIPLMPNSDQTNLHATGVDSSWEIDIFGRIGRSVESAQASLESDIEDYRDVLVSLYAQIAQSYIDVRSFQARIQYAQNNIKLQRETLELTRNRRDAELVPELDVQQAELVLASTESAVPTLRALEAQAIHRLGVLLGQTPSALFDELSLQVVIPKVPEEVTTGLPAELLRQRPDIRSAERVLASQTADIGAATAELYPSFSLSGTFAMEAQNADDLGHWDSRSWGFSPFVRWNLFDGNRIRNNIKVQESQTQQAMIDYEQTVLEALEEVENSMVAYVQEKERLSALNRTVSAAQKSVDLVKTLYENGLTDFQNVLDMQRTLTAQQDQLAQSQGQVAKNLVLIYKSLGGGWSVNNETTSNSNSKNNQ